jgi:hypothetical protein
MIHGTTPPEEAKTFTQWEAEGFRVIAGSKSTCRNENNEALFTRAQVTFVNRPRISNAPTRQPRAIDPQQLEQLKNTQNSSLPAPVSTPETNPVVESPINRWLTGVNFDGANEDGSVSWRQEYLASFIQDTPRIPTRVPEWTRPGRRNTTETRATRTTVTQFIRDWCRGNNVSDPRRFVINSSSGVSFDGENALVVRDTYNPDNLEYYVEPPLDIEALRAWLEMCTITERARNEGRVLISIDEDAADVEAYLSRSRRRSKAKAPKKETPIITDQTLVGKKRSIIL